MSIKYKVLPRYNPRDLEAPQKFYAAAISNCETNLVELTELISYQCKVTEADCHAVLLSLEHNIASELNEGRILKLGRKASFQIGISSKGKATAGEVSSSVITKNRILFRPGRKLRNLLGGLSYRKAG